MRNTLKPFMDMVIILMIIGLNSPGILWGETSYLAEIITPVQESPAADLSSMTPEYVNRIGTIRFATEVFLNIPVTAKDKVTRTRTNFLKNRLMFQFFDSETYLIQVDRQSIPGSDAVTLGGRILNKMPGTFTLTVTSKNFLISLQDTDAAVLYRVAGDSRTGAGKVTEIDLNRLPPAYDLHPPPPDRP